MSNRKIIKISSDDCMNIIEGALSGITGGTMLGSTFGITGAIVGALVGSFVTGYDAYKTVLKRYHTSGKADMLQDH